MIDNVVACNVARSVQVDRVVIAAKDRTVRVVDEDGVMVDHPTDGTRRSVPHNVGVHSIDEQRVGDRHVVDLR